MTSCEERPERKKKSAPSPVSLYNVAYNQLNTTQIQDQTTTLEAAMALSQLPQGEALSSPSFAIDSSLKMPFAATSETKSKRWDTFPQKLAVIFSTGDLGDVGRHVVAAALEHNWHCNDNCKVQIVVLSNNISTLYEPGWKCSCPQPHQFLANSGHEKEQQYSDNNCQHFWPQQQYCQSCLQLIQFDCTHDNAVQILITHLTGVDSIIVCVGNRKPFHGDCVAGVTMQLTLNAIQIMSQRLPDTKHDASPMPRLVLLSSAGIGEDWPPMEWSRSGDRLQAFYRTICWRQFQDLSRAEQAVLQYGKQFLTFDYLIARVVTLSEQTPPTGRWYVQNHKYHDHPLEEFAKSDAALFLLQEALYPKLYRKAVVVGGQPEEL